MLRSLVIGFSRTWCAAALAVMMLIPPVVLGAAAGVRVSNLTPVEWRTAARWRHGTRSTTGTLLISPGEVRFVSEPGTAETWRYEDIQTFYASPHRLVIRGYMNRGWHLPGTRSFRFDLSDAVPPAVAALLSGRIGKPSRNADPAADAPAFAVIAVRHPTRRGGDNGALRFRDRGIDYVTATPGASRSWRWQDIQTIANPDLYHFRVAGFRETFGFDLKQPMSRKLFDHLWNDLYGRGLQLGVQGGQSESGSGLAHTGRAEGR